MGRTTPHFARDRLSLGLLVAGVVLGAGGGTIVGAQQPAVYRATATVFVSTSSTPSVNDLVYVGERAPSPGVADPEQVASSYGDIATAPFMLNRVIRELDLRTTADALARRVRVVDPVDTPILRIGVDAAKPGDAVRIADGIARVEADAVGEPTPGAPGDSVQLALVEPSGRAVRQVLPDIPLDAVLGALAGLLVAVAFVLLRHRDAVRRRWRRWIAPGSDGASGPGRAPTMFD